jgi:BMFP domain-containing protein YqiC
MLIDWLEMMYRLAASARAKVAEDRRRFEELEAQSAEARGGVEASASGR